MSHVHQKMAPASIARTHTGDDMTQQDIRDLQFRIAMIGGPVDGELNTMVRRCGATMPGTTIGVPIVGTDPMQVAWYDRLGDEAMGGRWAFLYRETGGADRALRTFASTPTSTQLLA